ncbi:AMIN-like domain-containing (lipo)protein [Nocardia crassostreae]|uniref:AMIN-like domain-containing (lipo)protein n=1 Tax=Nocardia crassostreae TaxID=53428 RepID=UPI000833BBF5|nr:hypothetical protein [Nocardia crassostreae]
MRTRYAIAVTATTAVLTGCSMISEPETITTTGTSPAAPADIRGMPVYQSGENSPKFILPSDNSAVVVTAARTGGHPGFTRVVFDLAGPGRPGWDVAWVDRALQDGSGDALRIHGQSILEVRILGAGIPDGSIPVFTGGPSDPTVPAIADIVPAGVFEGVHQEFIGVNGPRVGFTVTALSNPTRLVIDISA